MSVVVARETGTYTEIWGVDLYARDSPGARHVDVFCEMAGIPADRRWPGSVLDAGTGSGKGALALSERGFVVTMADLTDAGLLPELRDSLTVKFIHAALWDDLRKTVGFVDYVYCTDVMEHIPPEFTMLTISRLWEVARKGVFLSICFEPDNMGAWVGKPLHQTVRPFTWWRDNLNTLGDVRECRDCLVSGVFWVTPR